MSEYDKCCIYKIISKDINITEVYVGHTIDFERILKFHRQKSNKRSYKLYNCIRFYGGWENFEIIKIEDYPCNSKQEAKIRQQYWITELKAELNIINASMETKNDRKENKKNYMRVYMKTCPFETCVCGSEVNIYKKTQHLNTLKHKNYIANI